MNLKNHQEVPLWGPYSKKYMGISRIMKESTVPGARYDLAVYPTYANSAVAVPNVTVPSDYHHWQADPHGEYYQYRYELIWKDELYADVDFFKMDEETWGIRVAYINQTDKSQNCLLNLFSAIEYPQKIRNILKLPKKADHVDALDYHDFQFKKKRPWDRLNPDGLKKGEVSCEEFTQGKGLGETYYCFMAAHLNLKLFGSEKGDRVHYKMDLKNQYKAPRLCIRYQTVFDDEHVLFDTNYGPVEFKKSKTPSMAYLSLNPLEPGEFHLELQAVGTKKNGVMIDYLAIVEEEDMEQVGVQSEKYPVVPDVKVEDGTTTYAYHNNEKKINLSILNPRVRQRKLYSGCLEDAVVTRLSNSDQTYDNLTRSFSGAFMQKHSDEGFYHTQVVEAIFLDPHSTRTEYLYVSATDAKYEKHQLEERWKSYKDQIKEQYNPQGEAYAQSVQLMKAALFLNVVYPIFRHGTPIVHYTPGKRWDSLYTWDSGLIGIGMLEYAPDQSEYVLDTYLSEEENEDFAFLSHGSLVPTQFYQLYELMQKAQGSQKLKYKKYYPMMKRYYDFYKGKSEGSTTSRYQSGLLTVYDYFYNASGMDDYPPQIALHKNHLENAVAPLCSSVQLVRIAKFMKIISTYFGYTTHVKEYEEDIEKMTKAILNHAWDEESGYFGYVVHNEDGEAEGIYRTETGENYNKGVDGVTPLIAGIGDHAQRGRMLKHLKSEDELLSPVGISTVDRSASYYYDNGYWNGSVWFPYQYFLWKSMLDLGEEDFAYEIAYRALNSWSQEADFSYNTFEMIQIESQRGGWFHQFGGLSAPIAVWFHAYYKPGTVTAGFDTWIESYDFHSEFTKGKIHYRITEKRKNMILVVMNENWKYDVTINGKNVNYKQHTKGALEIPLSELEGVIEIHKNERTI